MFIPFDLCLISFSKGSVFLWQQSPNISTWESSDLVGKSGVFRRISHNICLQLHKRAERLSGFSIN
jgi:hypothetical protein